MRCSTSQFYQNQSQLGPTVRPDHPVGSLHLHSAISCFSSNAFLPSLHLSVVIISSAFTCPSGVAREKSFGLVGTPMGGRGGCITYCAKSRSGPMVGPLARKATIANLLEPSHYKLDWLQGLPENRKSVTLNDCRCTC